MSFKVRHGQIVLKLCVHRIIDKDAAPEQVGTAQWWVVAPLPKFVFLRIAIVATGKESQRGGGSVTAVKEVGRAPVLRIK